MNLVLDFETEAIHDRPQYPPKSVGYAYMFDTGAEAHYVAYGHPVGNNTTREWGLNRLRGIVHATLRKGGSVLFHNAAFDTEVLLEETGIDLLADQRFDDTLFALFLTDPHAPTYGLKPSAERLLGMKPGEQEAVRDWLVEHRVVRRGDKDWGAYISKAPGGLVGEYAKGDVVRTLRLWEHLDAKMTRDGLWKAYNRERYLLPVMLENERQGMRLDVEALERDVRVYTDAFERSEAWLRAYLGRPALNFDAPAQLVDALRAIGAVTEFAKTKSGADSVSKATLTPDKFKDQELAQVLGYRNRLDTVLHTFLKPWKAGLDSNGRIHTRWNQVRGSEFGGARTGRMSCSPNFMNIPKDWYDKHDGYKHPFAIPLPELPQMRGYVLPDEGHVLLHRDYNQQELRVFAHFEDGVLAGAYIKNPRLDVHDFMQAAIERISGIRLERRAVKILNFGTLYGMGLKKLAKGLEPGVTERDLEENPNHPAILLAKQVKAAQREALPGLADLERGIKNRARGGLPVRTWGGRTYYAEAPKSVERADGYHVQTYEYKLLNYLTQGSAADVTKEALIRYSKMKNASRLLVTVHDEINISAEAGCAKREMETLRRAMESVGLDVPMLTDGKQGRSWGHLEAA